MLSALFTPAGAAGPTMTARLRGRVGDGEPAVYGSYLSISCGPEGRTFQHWSVIIAALILCAALLSLRAEAQKCSKPLSKDEIIDLLNSHVPATRVGDLAQQYGISFALTPEPRPSCARPELRMGSWKLFGLNPALPRRRPRPWQVVC